MRVAGSEDVRFCGLIGSARQVNCFPVDKDLHGRRQLVQGSCFSPAFKEVVDEVRTTSPITSRSSFVGRVLRKLSL